jgi:4-amino-4-deoxy-L-arabinose transferase-like glycosyltransferase
VEFSDLARPDRAGLAPAKEKLAFLLVVLFAIVYRFFGMTGDIMYDPAVYAQDAYNLLHGSFNLNTDSWYSHRLPVFVPVALFYGLMGVNSLSTNLWPLLLSLLQIVAVWWVGRRLFGTRTAVLAALFVAMMPLDVIYAGILNPDAVLASFLTLSVVLWILAFEGRAAPPWGLLFLSGLFCGLAVDTRAYALLIVVFFLGYAVWRRVPWRALLWWALGAAAVGVPVVLIYKFVTGDPLLPIRAMSGFYGDPERAEGSGLLYYPRLILGLKSYTGLFALFFTVTTVWALVRRTRERLLMLAWMAPILLYLQFGTMSLQAYVPVFKRVRFLTPFIAPAAILSASVVWEALGVMGELAERRLGVKDAAPVRRGLLGALVVVLLLNSLWIMKAHRTAHTAVANSFQSAASVVMSDPAVPVLFDHWRTSIRFGYYLRFEEGSHLYEGADETKRMVKGPATADTRLGYLKWYENAADLPDAFVVLEDGIVAEAERVSASDPTRSSFPAKDIPAYAHNPPDSWELLGRFGTLRVYRTR